MRKAIWKLTTRDKVIVLISVAIAVSVSAVLFFFLIAGFFSSDMEFPESTLVESDSLQVHQKREYTELNVLIIKIL